MDPWLVGLAMAAVVLVGVAIWLVTRDADERSEPEPPSPARPGMVAAGVLTTDSALGAGQRSMDRTDTEWSGGQERTMHEQVQGNPYQGTADPAASGRMPPTSTGMEVTAVGPDVVTTEPSFVADGRIGGSVAAGPMRVVPRAVGIGGGTLMMLLGAAGVGWYLIRRRREEQKPVNRLRRRLRVLQHDLEERMPEPTVEAAGPAGGATLALLLAGLLLRAFRQSRSRDAAADTSGSVQKVVAGAPMPPAAMETLQSGWRKISPIVRGAGETTRSRAKDLANVAGSAGDRVSGSRAQAGVGTGAVLAAAAAGYLAWRFLRRDEKASSYLNWDEGSINARRAPNQ